MKIKIKLLYPNSVMPKKAFDSDACFDVVATSKREYGDGRIEYGLGFSLGLPKGYRVDLRARSSIHKTGLILSNGIGTGDQDYIGEYKVVFYDVIPSLPSYEVGDRVAQIHFEEVQQIEFELTEELSETERGTGGYGSTNI